MGKYEPLAQFLSASQAEEQPLRFSEVEQMLGKPLPSSAFQYREWWANQNRSQSKSWMDAGWQVWSVDLGGERVVFRRTRHPRPQGRPTSGDSAPSGPWASPAIRIPEGRLGPAAMKIIENYAEEHGCDQAEAAAALLDRAGLNHRSALFAQLDALGMKPDSVSSAELVRQDRDRDGR
jgi:hypothetical protein